MPSKERQLLDQISKGKMSWGMESPADNTERWLKAFQFEAEDLKDVLANLKADGLIGDYGEHTESSTGHGHITKVYIKAGLTLEGQDKSQWPE